MRKMKIGIDNYCYHRFMGEVYDDQNAPFPPGPAYDIVKARVRIGDQEKSVPVSAEAQEASLSFTLAAGPTTLQTWFTTREGKEFGAHYVYIRR